MRLESVWTTLVYVIDILTFSSSGNRELVLKTSTELSASKIRTYPHFQVPKNPQSGEAFTCSYPELTDFTVCHSPTNRSCWLESKDKTFNVDSDSEILEGTPTGIVRRYNLNVSEIELSPDGYLMEHGKVFNGSYPGPWLEACWGDWLEVTVTNNLRYNGTSIHWHGLRQWGTPHHDGVNGITQCPIAPGDSFTYKFRATQYGSSWYHSHYSLQYGDGLLGPLTIYGPSTANYDSEEAFKPIIMDDWNHRSVFEDWPEMLASESAPNMTNILLNGIGQYGPNLGAQPPKYELQFDEGKRHLLILINTAVDTTFVFAIDEHFLEVIEADFVPIKPYTTDKILVGIGQRYHVIVKANPVRAEKNGNYWMRTMPATKCSKFDRAPDEKMGIVRYSKEGEKKDPTSNRFDFNFDCSDEPYDSLVPWRSWHVGNPANVDPNNKANKNPKDTKKAFKFVVGMTPSQGFPYVPDTKINRWDMHLAPFRINFSDPTILNHTQEAWPNHLDVVTMDNMEEDQWIWLLVTAPAVPEDGGQRVFFPAAHPMHLHGHDFALLKQSSTPWKNEENTTEFNCNGNGIKCDNPPRRDVVLLPASGFIIIAFKADNPGPWLMHCHIAFHASSGLAMQIIENAHLIDATFNGEKEELERVCRRWDTWFSNANNHWDSHNPDHFQDDSGI